ncbi:MAG: hypothetical protein DLM72_08520 [Candidatus Nitrosopolaris wilkensis]|nr:MAG: hypothetical protein DLM72_08520 [Candidatus Nitrosopolaris wilkensis]
MMGQTKGNTEDLEKEIKDLQIIIMNKAIFAVLPAIVIILGAVNAIHAIQTIAQEGLILDFVAIE